MIRGAKNPVPKVKPATNSGMFSGKGSQKMDGPAKLCTAGKAAATEAYKGTNRKIGSR